MCKVLSSKCWIIFEYSIFNQEDIYPNLLIDVQSIKFHDQSFLNTVFLTKRHLFQ